MNGQVRVPREEMAMLYGIKASQQRQCDALGTVLLGSLASWHSSECYSFSRVMRAATLKIMCEEFKVLIWPPNSPELNLVLDKQIGSIKEPSHNFITAAEVFVHTVQHTLLYYKVLQSPCLNYICRVVLIVQLIDACLYTLESKEAFEDPV